MKINDLEKCTGLKRSNIFYYEREGLLSPRREENNYREYSEEDLRRLKTIVVLRKLGFPVGEIRSLLDGERTLPELLPGNLDRLAAQSAEAEEAAALCRELERRGVTMESFDADEWFAAIESEERQGKRFLDLVDDMAEDVTKTLAFVQDTIGLNGPVWALYFFSEEGIKKRRLWKYYWLLTAVEAAWRLLFPMLLPWVYMRPAHPWAALAFLVVQGVAGSLALWFCAKYIIPGRKPRRALWLTIAVVAAVNLCLFPLGRQALGMETDEEARSSYLHSYDAGRGSIEDPLAYVRTEYGRYHSGAQLDSWEVGDGMFVFGSWGASFVFRRQDDGLWQELTADSLRTEAGVLYTADPYGPESYPSRLMLSDGTVLAPVYEARFDTGYIPVFAFDLTRGETYRGLLYGVDAAGQTRYGLRASYWLRPAGASDNAPGLFTAWGGAKILAAEEGPALLAAWRDWRAEIWSTQPTTVVGTAYLGVESSYLLYAEYIAPPSLVVSDALVGMPAEWGLNEYCEIVYPAEDGVRYVWNMSCAAAVTELVQSGAPTPAQLWSAAQTASAMGENPPEDVFAVWDFSSASPYAETRVWDGLPAPEALLARAQRVRAALDG